MKLLIIVEQTPTGYSAYSPDLDGCVATGPTREDVEREMRAAIELHLEGLREDGQDVPTPHSYATYVEVAAYQRMDLKIALVPKEVVCSLAGCAQDR